jgi:ketosteroid isomerase-like protein
MSRHALLALMSCVLLLTGCGSPAPRQEDVIAVLDTFYGAMDTGDAATVMQQVAEDAVFAEAGGLETRAEYEKNHLPSDIEFEKQVEGKRSPWQVTIEGDTAWAIATTEFDGTFNGNPVNLLSAQLAVLTRADGTWKIRSIAWSSRRR